MTDSSEKQARGEVGDLQKFPGLVAQVNDIAKEAHAAVQEAINLGGSAGVDKAVARLEAYVAKLAESLADDVSRSLLYEEWTGVLSEDAYVMPPELLESHDRLVNQDLPSGLPVGKFKHSGFLLYGVPGTGKNAYFSYLKHVLGDNAIFVVADLSRIRSSNTPGTLLKDLYSKLEGLAQSTGKPVFVMMDEFQKLMNKFAKVHGSKTDTTNENYDGRGRSTSRTESHNIETREVDQVGEELLSTLQAILDGTGVNGQNLQRVFTIATTNETVIPDSLTRGGRLDPICLKSFEMPMIEYGGILEEHDTVPDYTSYSQTLGRFMSILNALYSQDNSNSSPVLKTIQSELECLFEPLLEECSKLELPCHKNYAILCTLLKYFGVTEIDFNKEILQSKPILFSVLGKRDEEKGGATWAVSSRRSYDGKLHLDKGYGKEIGRMNSITPQEILKLFKSDRTIFDDYDRAKAAIVDFIFPQVPKLREMMKGSKFDGFVDS